LIHRALGSQRGESLDSFAFPDPPGLSALKALASIAAAERRKPGRKLLVWGRTRLLCRERSIPWRRIWPESLRYNLLVFHPAARGSHCSLQLFGGGNRSRSARAPL
jgi:hypothetical protein